MNDLIGKRIDFVDVMGWRYVGTLTGKDASSGKLRWVLEKAYQAFYTYEDGSNPHDWIYKGRILILDGTIATVGESLVDESNIKEPMRRRP